MKPVIKYTIAREILIFFGTCFLSLIIFLLSYLYNGYYNYKVEKEKKELQNIILLQQMRFDSLSHSNNLILRYWHESLINNVHFTEEVIGSYDTFASLILDPENQLNFKNNLTKSNKLGQKELTKVDTFLFTLNKNNKLKDSIKTEININNNKDIVSLSKKLTFEDQKNLGFGIFLILLILVYPLRFAYILIKWSLKTIRIKSDNG